MLWLFGLADELLELAGLLEAAGFDEDEFPELAGLLEAAGFDDDELLELAGLLDAAGFDEDELLELAGLLEAAGFDEDELLELAGLLDDVVLLLFSPGWGVYFVIDIEAILHLSVTSEVILKFSDDARPSLCTMVCLAVKLML